MRDWQRVSGYSNRNVAERSDRDPVSVVEYHVEVSPESGLPGKRIVFFSDLHFGSRSFDGEKFCRIFADLKADWIVFGGDLITYACYQDEAFKFIKAAVSLSPDAAKVAVLGNWDKRRISWYPNSKWHEAYKNLGFHLLVNENINLNRINFYGLDEPRIGTPEFDIDMLDKTGFNCVISHSVDPIIDTMSSNEVNPKQLILCGHSHGGQVRLPFFGAVITSSRYWKLFEYGHYHSPVKNADLIMTSGLGTTRMPFRFGCDPEIVVINLVMKEQ